MRSLLLSLKFMGFLVVVVVVDAVVVVGVLVVVVVGTTLIGAWLNLNSSCQRCYNRSLRSEIFKILRIIS